MAENNTQSRKWLLTINNPSEHGLNHAAICEILEKFKKLDYWCMCDEEGDECSTLHTHMSKEIIDEYYFVPWSTKIIFSPPLWKMFNTISREEYPQKQWKKW